MFVSNPLSETTDFIYSISELNYDTNYTHFLKNTSLYTVELEHIITPLKASLTSRELTRYEKVKNVIVHGPQPLSCKAPYPKILPRGLLELKWVMCTTLTFSNFNFPKLPGITKQLIAAKIVCINSKNRISDLSY